MPRPLRHRFRWRPNRPHARSRIRRSRAAHAARPRARARRGRAGDRVARIAGPCQLLVDFEQCLQAGAGVVQRVGIFGRNGRHQQLVWRVEPPPANDHQAKAVQVAGAMGCIARAPERPPVAHGPAPHRVIATSGNPDITCSIPVCDPRGPSGTPDAVRYGGIALNHFNSIPHGLDCRDPLGDSSGGATPGHRIRVLIACGFHWHS